MKIYSRRHAMSDNKQLEEKFSIKIDSSKGWSMQKVEVKGRNRKLQVEWKCEPAEDIFEFHSGLAAELDKILKGEIKIDYEAEFAELQHDFEHRDELEASYLKGLK